MMCGQHCPFCYGWIDGEGCVLLPQEWHHYKEVNIRNGERVYYPRSIHLDSVDGTAINEKGDIVSDVCRFNFEKFVIWYYKW